MTTLEKLGKRHWKIGSDVYSDMSKRNAQKLHHCVRLLNDPTYAAQCMAMKKQQRAIADYSKVRKEAAEVLEYCAAEGPTAPEPAHADTEFQRLVDLNS